MRTCTIILILIGLQVALIGCGQTRQIDPATPQSGPLIGTWEYIDDDLVNVEAGVVRNFVIGDGTWHIPKTLTFQLDGISKNTGYHDCHFWILDDGYLKLSVGNGNRVHRFRIQDDTLELILSGPFDGTSQTLTFTRVKHE